MKKIYILTLLFTSISTLLYSQKSIELSEIIKKYIPNTNNSDNNNYSWYIGAEKESEIKWSTNGLDYDKDYNAYREGEVIISIKGKTIECLGKNKQPCKWNLKLTGNKAGYYKFSINSIGSNELYSNYDIEELFESKNYKSRLIAMDNLYMSDGFKIYNIIFENKKEIFLKYWWSCGSAGCSVNIDCYTDKQSLGFVIHDEPE
jgi:hypothetical protein